MCYTFPSMRSTADKPTLTADEIGLINLVKQVKEGSGFGEVLACIKHAKVEMVKRTETVLI